MSEDLQGSMDAFILKLARTIAESNSHKPKSKFNLGATIAMTLVGNLITLPFGRVYMGFSKSRLKSANEIAADINGRLYSEFSTGVFTNANSKTEATRKRDLFRGFLDSLDESRKMAVVNLAFKDEKAYRKIVEDWLWQLAAKEVKDSA